MTAITDLSRSAALPCSNEFPIKVMLPPVGLHPQDFMRAQLAARAEGIAFPDFVALAIHRACLEIWAKG